MIFGTIVGAAALVVAVATWQLFGPRPSDKRSAEPLVSKERGGAQPGELRIESMEIKHYRGRQLQFRGVIGVTSYAANEEDDVRVKVSLSRSAYCYLIAFNPDGLGQLCYPRDSATPPARSDLLDFPLDGSSYFGLTDGPGVQTFLLAVSDEPLPPYDEWLSQVDKPPWQPRLKANAVWRFTAGGPLESQFVQQRGTIRQHGNPPRAFERLCKFFEQRKEFAAIQAMAFPVTPKKAAAVADKGKDP